MRPEGTTISGPGTIPHQIFYIIAVTSTELEDASLLQGLTPNLEAAGPLVEKVLKLPQSIFELAVDKTTAIANRIVVGLGYCIVPLDQQYLSELASRPPSPFTCVVASEETLGSALQAQQQWPLPLLVLSGCEHSTTPRIETFDRKAMHAWVSTVLQHMAGQFPEELVNTYRATVSSYVEWQTEEGDLERSGHLLTLANELTLGSMWIQLSSSKQIDPYNESPLVDAMLESARAVTEHRRRALISLPPEVERESLAAIVAAPAIYKHWYGKAPAPNAGVEKDEDRAFRLTLKLLVRQEGYRLYFTPENLRLITTSRSGMSLLRLRTQETKLVVAALAARAASACAPVYRVRPLVNRIQGGLRQLGEAARSVSRRRREVEWTKFKEIVSTLDNGVGEQIAADLRSLSGHIKFVSDVPLEWMSYNSLPIGLARETSRIAATPGNLCFGELCRTATTDLPLEAFDDILVVSSFMDGDPVKHYLRRALTLFKVAPVVISRKTNWQPQSETRKLVRWAEVASSKDLEDVLNAYDGQLLIFDGHGKSDGAGGGGALMLGTEAFDTWGLKGRARVPRLVILSACDTHALDGSHASVANGFLGSGALAVLATTLPIDAANAASFVARFLLRLREYLPELAARPIGVRWSQLVAEMLRMAHATEVFQWATRTYNHLNWEDHFLKFQRLANDEILRSPHGWAFGALDELAALIGIQGDELRMRLRDEGPLTDSMKHVLMGVPENIRVLDPDALRRRIDEGAAVRTSG